MAARPSTGIRPPMVNFGGTMSAAANAMMTMNMQSGLGGTMSVRPTTGAVLGGGTTLGRIQAQLQEGTFTATIYTLIRDHQYSEAIELLSPQLDEFGRSRAALSLLAYCYYMSGDYVQSASFYDQLIRVCPSVDEYRVYYAQALYKAGEYAESSKTTSLIENEQHDLRLSKLQASIAYEQEDIPQTKSFLEKCANEDPDVTILQGCVMCKENGFAEALAKFQEVQNTIGAKMSLLYNCALCHYRMQQYGPALKYLSDIIDKGVQEHPEFNIGSNTEGTEARSVGNTLLLKESALIEAFNLKAAIEFTLKNYTSAKEAMTDMPPRSEEEFDPVTLHNTALINMSEDPTNGFKKLNFLLQNPPFPPETFQNLLLFYCKYQYYDLAADVLAENPHLAWQYLSQNHQSLYDFLDGLITAQTAPAEAYRKFDILSQKHIDQLRKITKRMQDAKQNHDKDGVKAAVRVYDEALDEYIPVLMAQANIY